MTGILTFHRGPNYGGFLQAWHLREAVRSLGHSAETINYQGLRHHDAERLRFRGVSPGLLKGMLLHYLKSRPFRGPVGGLEFGPFRTSAEGIDWQSFDTVVVGSDIVWDFRAAHFGGDQAYFGALPCQAETRFVAYAPSCGETPADAEIPDYVRSGLRRFDAIHVRDRNTADMVRNATGIEPPLVVDPTWLQDDPEVPYPGRPSGPYILMYGLGMSSERAKVLGDFCKKHGLELIAVAFPCATADRKIQSIGPFEWVDLFRHASGVVTSTFHGLLYAIKYAKPLVFMERGASRLKGRIAIERCGLEDRVVPEGEPFEAGFIKMALAPERPAALPGEWIAESRARLRSSLGPAS